MKDSTQRFSDRVEDYIRYRPHYPAGFVSILEKLIPVNNTMLVADIGCGTGISSIPFLEKEYRVMGVEPNREMRAAAGRFLSAFSHFAAVDGTAEHTGLADESVDLIFCGQSFHWFDKEKSKQEFNRILKQDGHQALVWNARVPKSAFQRDYEQMLKDHIPQSEVVNHNSVNDDVIAAFFSPKPMNKICVDNRQVLDFDGLSGRLRSSSYFPKSGPVHEAIMKELAAIFERYKENDTIVFEYETQVYWC